jgi:hypothetical protein
MWYGQHLCFDGNVKRIGSRRVEWNEHTRFHPSEFKKGNGWVAIMEGFLHFRLTAWGIWRRIVSVSE